MQFRPLGNTGIEVSVLSFGGGPISSLMVGEDRELQNTVIAKCLEAGINWFDTAASYGAGRSECNLGRVLEELGATSRIHVATKVRLLPEDSGNIRDAVRRSFDESLRRLRRPRVTLLQLHNSITPRRDDEPTSITPADVLGPCGVADTFDELRTEGLVEHLGLTGIGDPAALKQVIRSGRFATMQVPYNLLNPSGGQVMSRGFSEIDYGNILSVCAGQQMGVLAIRVLAGGALANQPPSRHTLTTPFFPIALYERDQRRAAKLRDLLGPERQLPREAIQFALRHPAVSSALIGFADPSQVDYALASLSADEPAVDWERVVAAMYGNA